LGYGVPFKIGHGPLVEGRLGCTICLIFFWQYQSNAVLHDTMWVCSSKGGVQGTASTIIHLNTRAHLLMGSLGMKGSRGGVGGKVSVLGWF